MANEAAEAPTPILYGLIAELRMHPPTVPKKRSSAYLILLLIRNSMKKPFIKKKIVFINRC
jgi:hypothetical protein